MPIRKTMEDVVTHHNERPQLISGTSKQLHHKLESTVAHKNVPNGEHRIEGNPFFQKVRPASEISPRGEDQQRTGKPRVFLWSFAILSLLVVVFFVANFFSSATAEIVPLTYRGHIEKDFVATKESNGASVEGGALPFHFISLVDEKSQDVPATTEQKVQKKAAGKVIIYNEYSKGTQKLVQNTRLESANHKIYRISQSVVVPGSKTVAGKIEPGSVEVLAYADAPGVDYNIGSGDFTIPGFKGDPRYTKFTARSKTDSPMAGGFSGTVNVPSENDVKKAQELLRESLKTSTIEKARALIPPGMSFFPGSTVLKFEDVPQDYSASDVTKVTVRATVSVFFFDTSLITQKIALAALTDYQGNPVTLANLSSIAFSFMDPVGNIVLSDLTKVRFHIVGDPVFIGTVDTEKIQNDLIGKDKKDFAKIIIGEQNIGKAEATIRPMWKTTFPLDPKKIEIKVIEPEK